MLYVKLAFIGFAIAWAFNYFRLKGKEYRKQQKENDDFINNSFK